MGICVTLLLLCRVSLKLCTLYEQVVLETFEVSVVEKVLRHITPVGGNVPGRQSVEHAVASSDDVLADDTSDEYDANDSFINDDSMDFTSGGESVDLES